MQLYEVMFGEDTCIYGSHPFVIQQIFYNCKVPGIAFADGAQYLSRQISYSHEAYILVRRDSTSVKIICIVINATKIIK